MQHSSLATLILGVVSAVAIVVLQLTGGIQLGFPSSFNLPFSWLPFIGLFSAVLYNAFKLLWKTTGKIAEAEAEDYSKVFRASVIQIIKEEFPQLVQKEEDK